MPEGAKIESKVVFTPDNLDLPCELTPLANGKYGVSFKPSRGGEYVVHANLVDKDGKVAKLKGTPIKLNLSLPDPKPEPEHKDRLLPVAGAADLATRGRSSSGGASTMGTAEPAAVKAAENSTVDLKKLGSGLNSDGNLEFEIDSKDVPEGSKVDTKIVFVPDNLDLPADIKPLGHGKYGVAFKPVRTGEYTLNANVVDKHGKAAKLKGTPITINLTIPVSKSRPAHEQAHIAAVNEEETDELHTIMWTHSFVIEAHTIKGVPRIKGGDKFAVAISGPKGPVQNTDVKDLGTGKYLVTYTLPGHGEYSIKVTINGRNIVGSPFIQRL